jgi:UDP-N-acetylglucosamine 1-carboxyvinyltransferase
MDKFIITGGNKIKGEIKVSGAKNVAMKVLLTSLLTDKDINIGNVPEISSVLTTAEIVKILGVKIKHKGNHVLTINGSDLKSYKIPLDLGGISRAASMVMGPLLLRFGKAVVPNPGGCRIGKRSIERHIDGLIKMGAKIVNKDGYFFAEANKLKGVNYTFTSNTHTGTETLILAAVLADGETVLRNAAEEPEIDDLILLLNKMGALVKRSENRTIVIKGVKKLIGADHEIMPDRNEVVTFAVGALASGGDVIIEGTQREHLKSFLIKVEEANGQWEAVSDVKTRFFQSKKMRRTNTQTSAHPGFMTDWQSPWALLMTQSEGVSSIHETVYEDRFGYVRELEKLGAKITRYNPKIPNPEKFYNFNWSDRAEDSYHAIKITGKTVFHNAVLEVMDLRAGATLVLGACLAEGDSIIRGIEHIDRGYERLEERLRKLNVNIKRVKEMQE